jgi:tripeptidyl-peptidase I
MLFSILSSALLLGGSVLAEPTTRSPFAIKSHNDVPRGWTKVGAPSPHHPLSLRIAFKQPKFSQLEDLLAEISDPDSPRWREHLTKEEVDELSAPHSTSLSLLDEYLEDHGIDTSSIERTSAKDWATITVTVAQAEQLLDTEYSIYVNVETGHQVIRTTTYKLPVHLHGHVDTVQPTNYFGNVQAHATDLSVLDEAAAAKFNITIPAIRALYNVNNYTVHANKKSKYGLTGYVSF